MKVMLLRQLRKAKGWSQAELARQVGCHFTSICNIEAGREQLWPIRGKKIADALGWTGEPEAMLELIEVTE